MRHLHLTSKERPQTAQDLNPVIKSIINGLIFGVNPLFLLLISQKIQGKDNDGGTNGTGGM